MAVLGEMEEEQEGQCVRCGQCVLSQPVKT